MFIVGNIVGL
jgi:hypothetical protein